MDFSCFKQIFLMEKDRIESYKKWPFDENSSCNILKMAEAGFYWNGNKHENDTVTCFVCAKTLDGWEATDDPWKEHKKHAPQCMFVKYGRRESDLTVKEFLHIFGATLINRTMQDTNDIKKEFCKLANADLDAFIRNK